jgi:hypothetical protein
MIAMYVHQVNKLKGLRDTFRESVRSLSPDASAVVLLDGDLREYPSPDAIVRSIVRVMKGEWDLLCANGRWKFDQQDALLWGAPDRYYDTFATVLSDGTYGNPMRTPAYERHKQTRFGYSCCMFVRTLLNSCAFFFVSLTRRLCMCHPLLNLAF